MHMSTQETRKEHQFPLEVEVQKDVSSPTWVLGTELTYSRREASVFNQWAISPAHDFLFFFNFTCMSIHLPVCICTVSWKNLKCFKKLFRVSERFAVLVNILYFVIDDSNNQELLVFLLLNKYFFLHHHIHFVSLTICKDVLIFSLLLKFPWLPIR